MDTIRLLLVEDEPELRACLKSLFTEEGYQVGTAANGQEALEQLEHQPVQLVLTDLGMPGMDGLHLIQALRQKEAGRAAPLVAMSANRAALHQAVELGVSHVLEKPFDLDALLALIATSLA